ncbi:MAG: DNA methyltransferase, partial [Candidatus Eremiobacterota bacterium]
SKSEKYINIPFDFPKNIEVIYNLITGSCDMGNIILDFFAGSSSTGHAVFEYNYKNVKAKHKFILVQLDELIDEKNDIKANYKNISAIAIERLKQACKYYRENSNEWKEYSFKVFKLQKSNFRTWNDYEGADIKGLEAHYDLFESPLIEDWTEESLLTEILLCEGFPLDRRIERFDNNGNTLFRVSSDFCEHKLLICLDKNVEAVTVENLELRDDEIFICLDNAINDVQKLILTDKGVIKTI